MCSKILKETWIKTDMDGIKMKKMQNLVLRIKIYKIKNSWFLIAARHWRRKYQRTQIYDIKLSKPKHKEK